MEEKLLNKCREWIGEEISTDNISVVIREDDGTWHRRVYLIAWNDDDGYTHVNLIRVWTMDNGNRIDLSNDYENCVYIVNFVDTLPSIMAEIERVR